MQNTSDSPAVASRRQITVTFKRPKDIEKWEEAARLLGYPDACDAIRELAEEARVLAIAKREAAAHLIAGTAA